MDDSIQQRIFAQHALAIGETLADIRLQVAANFLLGGACLDSGEYRRAAAMFRTAVASLDDDLTRDRCGLFGYPAVLSRAYLARALTECGAFDQGIVVGKEALRIAETLGHSVSLIQAFRFLGYLYSVKGEVPRAADLLECGLALAREGNLPFLSAGLTGMLGDVYAHWGRVTEGLTLLLQTLQARDAMGTEGTGLYALFLVHPGHVYVLVNRLEDARASAGRALTVARERRGQGDEAYALRLLGEIAAHGDPLDAATAEYHYCQALTLATQLAMRPLVAHCHLGLGKLYRKTGDAAKAEEHLATATTMYREMDMGFWLAQAESGLA
jgi:tetratricopeptide (TPR) repeat protein